MKWTGSASDLVTFLFGAGGFIVVIAMGALACFFPLMLFSIMRSMKGIRRELETLNETLQNKLVIR
jgi:hypothetical protein